MRAPSRLAHDVTKSDADGALSNKAFQGLDNHIQNAGTKAFKDLSSFNDSTLNVTTDAEDVTFGPPASTSVRALARVSTP